MVCYLSVDIIIPRIAWYVNRFFKLNSNITNARITKNVNPSIYTIFYDSGPLPDGLYLICAHAASEISIDNTYVLDVMYGGFSKQAVRGNMLNGGGICNTAIIQCSSGQSIGARIYQMHTSQVEITANISVVRLH